MQTKVEKEKSPELYTFLWETFKLSQGDPDLQILFFDWMSTQGLLPKNIPDTVPRTVFREFGPPEQHVVSGHHQEFDWEEAREKVGKYVHNLDPKLGSLIIRFMANDVYDPDELKEIEMVFKKKLAKITRLPEEAELFRQLGSDAFRKREVIKIWLGLIDSKNTTAQSAELLDQILEGMLKRDIKYLSPLSNLDEYDYRDEGRPRRGRSLKPDDQYDRFASYVRIYIFNKNKEMHSPGASTMLKKLHEYVHSNSLRADHIEKIKELIKLWEFRHPKHKFL